MHNGLQYIRRTWVQGVTPRGPAPAPFASERTWCRACRAASPAFTPSSCPPHRCLPSPLPRPPHCATGTSTCCSSRCCATACRVSRRGVSMTGVMWCDVMLRQQRAPPAVARCRRSCLLRGTLHAVVDAAEQPAGRHSLPRFCQPAHLAHRLPPPPASALPPHQTVATCCCTTAPPSRLLLPAMVRSRGGGGAEEGQRGEGGSWVLLQRPQVPPTPCRTCAGACRIVPLPTSPPLPLPLLPSIQAPT